MNDSLLSYQDDKGGFFMFPGKKQKIKQQLVLEQLASYFDTGRKYTEKQVNEILNQHHTFEDHASLRRLMFGKGAAGSYIGWKELLEELNFIT